MAAVAQRLGLALLLLPLGGCGQAADEALDVTRCAAELAPEDGVLLMLEELGPPVLSAVDLATSAQSTVFEVPSQGFAYEFDARDQGIALAYTAPPADGDEGYDRSVLVLLVDGALVPLSGDGTQGAWSFYPTWSADGAAVWFVASGQGTDATSVLSRLDVATGAVTHMVDDATEPAVSPDGAALAWVAVDPVSGARSLVLAAADASDPQIVAEPSLGDLGQPFFSSDGRWLTFVVLADPEPDEGSLWDLLVPTATAHESHDAEGDWWRVSVDGGVPERVSFLQTIHYDGAASPSGDAFVAATREGVVRIDPGAGEVRALNCLRTVRAVGFSPTAPSPIAI